MKTPSTVDLEYINTGLFTRFMPNTAAGEDAWREIANQGHEAILSIHAKNVIFQLRKAGYSVAKAKKAKPVTAQEVNDLLTALGV